MKKTTVEWLENKVWELDNENFTLPNELFEMISYAKEMEKQQQGYSEEEVLPLLEILEKCKEYFLLKTDAKSEERADAIGQAIEDFKKLKNK
jgi:cell division septum initiation protein DivIVA